MRRVCIGAAYTGVTAVLVSLGCGESIVLPSAPDTGAIEISASATGASIDFDADGFTFSVDGAGGQRIVLNAPLIYVGQSIGKHEIVLDGVAANCLLDGGGPAHRRCHCRRARHCCVHDVVRANVGTLRVTTSSSGSGADSNHYRVVLPGLGNVGLDANGTQTFESVRVGTFLLTLNNVPANCAVDRTPSVSLGYKTTVEVALVVRCSETGSIQINASTTGFDLDPDGYGVEIKGSSVTKNSSVPVNGSSTVTGLLPGSYVLTFFNFVSNCAPSQGPRVVTVEEKASTLVTLDVTCTAATRIAYVSGIGSSADIRVVTSNGVSDVALTNAFGSDADPAGHRMGSALLFRAIATVAPAFIS